MLYNWLAKGSNDNKNNNHYTQRLVMYKKYSLVFCFAALHAAEVPKNQIVMTFKDGTQLDQWKHLSDTDVEKYYPLTLEGTPNHFVPSNLYHARNMRAMLKARPVVNEWKKKDALVPALFVGAGAVAGALFGNKNQALFAGAALAALALVEKRFIKRRTETQYNEYMKIFDVTETLDESNRIVTFTTHPKFQEVYITNRSRENIEALVKSLLEYSSVSSSTEQKVGSSGIDMTFSSKMDGFWNADTFRHGYNEFNNISNK